MTLVTTLVLKSSVSDGCDAGGGRGTGSLTAYTCSSLAVGLSRSCNITDLFFYPCENDDLKTQLPLLSIHLVHGAAYRTDNMWYVEQFLKISNDETLISTVIFRIGVFLTRNPDRIIEK